TARALPRAARPCLNGRQAGGDADDGRGGNDVRCHDGAGADERTLTDRDAAEDDSTRADRRATADDDRQQRPVRLRLQSALVRRGARPLIVDEHNPMPDEDVVLDSHAVADERVALDLAVRADDSAALDLDVGADTRVVADLAAVE